MSLLFIFAGTSIAANPKPGWYGDDRGTGELVLDYDLAYALARTSGSSTSDPLVRANIDKLVAWAEIYAPAVAKVSIASTIVSALMLANRFQMMNETSIPNYEVYGFTMYRWVSLSARAYPYPDYTLLREQGDSTVYVVVANAKFWVRNSSYPHYRPSTIKIVPRGRLAGWRPLWKPGALLREQSNATVYLIGLGTINPQFTWVSSTNQQGTVRRAVSGSAFSRLGFSFSNVRMLPDGAFASPNPYIPRGYDIL